MQNMFASKQEWKKGPTISTDYHLQLPSVQLDQLSNGVPVYATLQGTQPIVRIDACFFAGRPYERKRLAARSANGLLREGTAKYTAEQIAELTDFHGAFLNNPMTIDLLAIMTSSLDKYFDDILPVFQDVVLSPQFPEDELEQFVKRNSQRIRIEMSKTDSIAYRMFTELLYGEDHYYGYNSFPETYQALVRDDLVTHYEEHCHAGNMVLFISGRPPVNYLDHLEKAFGQMPYRVPSEPLIVPEIARRAGRQDIKLPNSQQSSIRIGFRTFTRKHPDFAPLQMAAMMLGGYFGSRLMNQVREEKGLTYNISASLEAMLYDGYFCVSTDTSHNLVDEVIEDIFIEMEKMASVPASEEELQMLKSYLLGNALNLLDGPFNTNQLVKNTILDGLPLQHFEETVEYLRNCTAEDVMHISKKYFRREEMLIVVAGA